MGIARPKDLSDLIRLEAHLKVTCPDCGRSGIFPVKDIIAYFRSRNWNSAWSVAGRRFRCEGLGPDRGCGRRGATLSLSPIAPPAAASVPRPSVADIKKQIRRERN